MHNWQPTKCFRTWAHSLFLWIGISTEVGNSWKPTVNFRSSHHISYTQAPNWKYPRVYFRSRQSRWWFECFQVCLLIRTSQWDKTLSMQCRFTVQWWTLNFGKTAAGSFLLLSCLRYPADDFISTPSWSTCPIEYAGLVCNATTLRYIVARIDSMCGIVRH